MSSRGRGYGRGSSRGGYRGSYRGGSSSRGSYDSRGRGGSGYSSNYSSERYHTSSSDRYGGSSKYDREDTFKKPYRPDYSSSNRDYSSRPLSPDRKRMRIEGSSSDRRAHDTGGHYTSSRNDSYSSDRRTSYSEDRRRSPRDSYRKPSAPMSAPRTPPPRQSRPLRPLIRSVRRPTRGRPLRSRGSYRGTFRSSRGSYLGTTRKVVSLEYHKTRPTKIHSSLKVKPESGSSDGEEDWDAEEKKVKEKSDISDKPKETTKASGDVADDDAQSEEGSATDKEGGAMSEEGEVDDTDTTTKTSKVFHCPHCKEDYPSVPSYTKHLTSNRHRNSMSGIAARYKARLLRMRALQRTAQRELESARGARLIAQTAYCPICRLNFRTTRHAHTLTRAHRVMKKMLTPTCTVCGVQFQSAMQYEYHIASLEHLKKQNSRLVHVNDDPASGDEVMDVDLDNFMTLDSVGDVDEVDDDESDGEKKEGVNEEKKTKAEINIGKDHVKKVEVHWCELCRVYLEPAGSCNPEEYNELIRRHCRLRLHLSRYVRHRDTRTLRKQAERIHKQLQAQKENKETGESPIKEETTVKSEAAPTKIHNEATENGTVNHSGEEKLWADVDKDIGDLLAEVDPSGHKISDDEDDLDRYDKFKKTDTAASTPTSDTLVKPAQVEA